MSENITNSDEPLEEAQNPSLAEVSARRLAARTQWQLALARAKERFAPANMTNEAIDRAAGVVGDAADKTATLAWTHRGWIALAGLFGGLFFARKPLARNAGPLAKRAKASLTNAAVAVKNLKKR